MVSLIEENSYVTEVVTLMEGDWLCYRSGCFNGGGLFNGGENGCYRGGQRENSHVTEVDSLMEGEWSL